MLVFSSALLLVDLSAGLLEKSSTVNVDESCASMQWRSMYAKSINIINVIVNNESEINP